MFYEPTYRATYPFISQLSNPAGFWMHVHTSAVRRFAFAYSEKQA